jgi:hypothetical protein
MRQCGQLRCQAFLVVLGRLSFVWPIVKPVLTLETTPQPDFGLSIVLRSSFLVSCQRLDLASGQHRGWVVGSEYTELGG